MSIVYANMKLWVAVRTHARISAIVEEIKSNPSISLGKGDPDNRRLYLAQQRFIKYDSDITDNELYKK